MSDHAPQVEELAVARLTVDHTVQRALDKLRVDKLAADYKPDAIGVIVVSARDDGTVHVIDGQHRVAATIAAGFGERNLPCMVYKGLNRAEEAAMFRRLNNTRGVQALDKFRVRVIEEDPVAVVLNDLLSRRGWTVGWSKADGWFAAVTALENLYRASKNTEGEHDAVCDTTLRVVTEAWGHNADGVRSEVIAGVGAVVLRHGDGVDLAKLVSELSQFRGGPRTLIGQAKSLRDIRGGRLGDSFAEIVINLVNKSRRSRRLPDWHSVS